MIKLAFKTKKGQEEIMDEAVRYFQKNTRLKMTERGSCCVIFGEMYVDYVMVSLSQEDDTFEVTVESKEHEYMAQKFAEKFK
jgi:hypothetical protein